MDELLHAVDVYALSCIKAGIPIDNLLPVKSNTNFQKLIELHEFSVKVLQLGPNNFKSRSPAIPLNLPVLSLESLIVNLLEEKQTIEAIELLTSLENPKFCISKNILELLLLQVTNANRNQSINNKTFLKTKNGTVQSNEHGSISTDTVLPQSSTNAGLSSLDKLYEGEMLHLDEIKTQAVLTYLQSLPIANISLTLEHFTELFSKYKHSSLNLFLHQSLDTSAAIWEFLGGLISELVIEDSSAATAKASENQPLTHVQLLETILKWFAADVALNLKNLPKCHFLKLITPFQNFSSGFITNLRSPIDFLESVLDKAFLTRKERPMLSDQLMSIAHLHIDILISTSHAGRIDLNVLVSELYNILSNLKDEQKKTFVLQGIHSKVLKLRLLDIDIFTLHLKKIPESQISNRAKPKRQTRQAKSKIEADSGQDHLPPLADTENQSTHVRFSVNSAIGLEKLLYMLKSINSANKDKNNFADLKRLTSHDTQYFSNRNVIMDKMTIFVNTFLRQTLEFNQFADKAQSCGLQVTKIDPKPFEQLLPPLHELYTNQLPSRSISLRKKSLAPDNNINQDETEQKILSHLCNIITKMSTDLASD